MEQVPEIIPQSESSMQIDSSLENEEKKGELKVLLQTADGLKLEVLAADASCSQVLVERYYQAVAKQANPEACDGVTIQVPKIRSKEVLEEVIGWMGQNRAMLDGELHVSELDQLKELHNYSAWNRTFIKELFRQGEQLAKFYDVMKAADDLKLTGLKRLGGAFIAYMLTQRSPRSVRRMFRLEDDIRKSQKASAQQAIRWLASNSSSTKDCIKK